MIILVLAEPGDSGGPGIHVFKFNSLSEIEMDKLTEPDAYGHAWTDFGSWAIFDTDKPQKETQILGDPIWNYGGTKLEQLSGQEER